MGDSTVTRQAWHIYEGETISEASAVLLLRTAKALIAGRVHSAASPVLP